jgi:hypothetical protein
MSGPRRAFRQPAAQPVVESVASVESPFGPNDVGVLRPDTRRALLQLVRGPYLMRERHSKLWAALESDEALIRAGLGNLFLELVLDRDEGLAFARNLRTEEDVPKVMRSVPLTLIDTALVLFLRDKLLRTDRGRAFVGRDEIDDQLQVYGAAVRADAVGLSKRITSSVEKLKRNNILQATDEDGRFEISPVLRMVFDATQVNAVAAELRELLKSGESIVEDGESASDVTDDFAGEASDDSASEGEVR